MLKFHKHIFVFAIIAAICVVFSSTTAAEKSSTPQKPKYIFLMIGDGMGVALRAAKHAVPLHYEVQHDPVESGDAETPPRADPAGREGIDPQS